MDEVLKYAIFAALTIFIVYEMMAGLRATEKIIELPFLFAATYLLLIYPSLFSNLQSTENISTLQFNMYGGFSLLCLGSASIVYKKGLNRTSSRTNSRSVNRAEKWGANVVSPVSLLIPFVIGLLCTLRINPSEYGEKLGGDFAIQLFLARILRPVAIVAWTQYLWSRCKISLTIAFVSFLSFLPFVFISGRRSDTLFILLAVTAPIIVVRGWRPTKKLMMSGLMAAFFIFYLWPTLRTFTKAGEYGAMGSVSLSDAVTKKMDGTDSNETINAAERMEITYTAGRYMGLAPFSNSFVQLYVSSTIFGESFKKSFFIDAPTPEEVRKSASENGLTKLKSDLIKWWLSPTGVGDAFSSLGWFGFTYFCGFAYVVKWLFINSKRSLELRPKMIYCLFVIFIPYAIYDSIAAIGPFFLPYLLVYFWARLWQIVSSPSRSSKKILTRGNKLPAKR